MQVSEDKVVEKNTKNELLTTIDLERMFEVTSMTIYNWRKTKALPEVRIPGHQRDTIRFNKSDVLAWAEKNGVTIKNG